MTPLDGLLQAMEAQRRYKNVDPSALTHAKQVAQGRAQSIEEGYEMNPGRQAGGSGTTGLASQDSHGWSDMLNEQTEYQNLQNSLANKPLSVIQLREGAANPYKPKPAQKSPPESHDAFMRRYGR